MILILFGLPKVLLRLKVDQISMITMILRQLFVVLLKHRKKDARKKRRRSKEPKKNSRNKNNLKKNRDKLLHKYQHNQNKLKIII